MEGDTGMNEQIRQFAEQAGLEFDDGLVLESEPIYYTSQKDLEKFAELIVRECVSVINTEAAAEHEDDNEIERAWKMGTEFAVYQIKQHFGVEE